MAKAKKPTPQKRVAPRDKEDREWNAPLSLDEMVALAAKREEAIASGRPHLPNSTFDLSIVRWLGATIDRDLMLGDAILASVVIQGNVERPEASAQAKEQTITIRIPAKVTRYEEGEQAASEPPPP